MERSVVVDIVETRLSCATVTSRWDISLSTGETLGLWMFYNLDEFQILNAHSSSVEVSFNKYAEA